MNVYMISEGPYYKDDFLFINDIDRMIFTSCKHPLQFGMRIQSYCHDLNGPRIFCVDYGVSSFPVYLSGLSHFIVLKTP